MAKIAGTALAVIAEALARNSKRQKRAKAKAADGKTCKVKKTSD